MLAGCVRVVEVGAQSGELSELVRREVGELLLTDKVGGGEVLKHDILESPVGLCDGIYSLDVIEHIEPLDTEWFLKNMKLSLKPRGVCIIGSPTLRSREFATEKAAHINCMSPQELRRRMRVHFEPVFMFGMNDEVLHTGFDAMRHYNFAVGVC